MKRKNSELVEILIQRLTEMKKNVAGIVFHKNILKHNERFALFTLHKVLNDNETSLSVLREKMCLAPSTITPIITSLEEKGLIERVIDKSDRRNILIKTSTKGLEYINDTYNEIHGYASDLIDYLGEEDTMKLTELLEKTSTFFKERREG